MEVSYIKFLGIFYVFFKTDGKIPILKQDPSSMVIGQRTRGFKEAEVLTNGVYTPAEEIMKEFVQFIPCSQNICLIQKSSQWLKHINAECYEAYYSRADFTE